MLGKPKAVPTFIRNNNNLIEWSGGTLQIHESKLVNKARLQKFAVHYPEIGGRISQPNPNFGIDIPNFFLPF